MIQVSYSSNIEDKYYEIIAQSKMQQFKNRTFESYYNQFGEYLSDNLHKRPLSKLIRDISQELGLT